MAEKTPSLPNPADFLSAWQQMAAQGEQQTNQYFNQMMGTEPFANMMGKYLEGYLSMQASVARSVEKYMQAANLPMRSDITALGERLAAIESQLSLITAEQRALTKQLEAAPRSAPAATSPTEPPCAGTSSANRSRVRASHWEAPMTSNTAPALDAHPSFRRRRLRRIPGRDAAHNAAVVAHARSAHEQRRMRGWGRRRKTWSGSRAPPQLYRYRATTPTVIPCRC